jgi:osmoprotectant transport system permease protein
VGAEPHVNALSDAFVWLNDPLNWQGKQGVPYLTYEHLYISFLAVFWAALFSWPVALLLGHTGRGGGFTVLLTNVSRAIPTLALLTVFAATDIGFGNRATIVALAVFAIPPLLTNTYVGIRGVDREVVESARGMGLTERAILLRVELPLAVPLIAAGLRTAAVQVVATATLAALVGGGGLGVIINTGFGQQDRPQILAGGILVALLALLTEGVLALVQRSVTPGRVRKHGRRGVRRDGDAEGTDVPDVRDGEESPSQDRPVAVS